MLERTIKYVLSASFGWKLKEKFFEEIKYGEIISLVTFPHEIRYRFETWEIKQEEVL